MSDLSARAEQVLDEFIFRNIHNHYNRHEDEWDITYEGNDFLLRHRETNEMFVIEVKYQAGTMSAEKMKQLGDDQEWWEDEY